MVPLRTPVKRNELLVGFAGDPYPPPPTTGRYLFYLFFLFYGRTFVELPPPVLVSLHDFAQSSWAKGAGDVVPTVPFYFSYKVPFPLPLLRPPGDALGPLLFSPPPVFGHNALLMLRGRYL